MQNERSEPRVKGVFDQRQSPVAARREFELESKRILDGWVGRLRLVSQGKASILAEDPKDWMLRCTYRLVKALIAAGHAGILSDLVAEVAQRHAGKTDISDKPFKQALLVMFWWNPIHATPHLIDRRRRSELSDAMEYAYLHHVRSCDLKRFITVVGIKRIPVKLRAGASEQGFKIRALSRRQSVTTKARNTFIEIVE